MAPPRCYGSVRVCLAALLWVATAQPGLAQDSAHRRWPGPETWARMHLLVGDHYLGKQDLAAAADAYLKALRTDRESIALPQRLEIIRHIAEAGRLREAIEELETVGRQNADDVETRVLLAQYLAWTAQPQRAIAVADEALHLAPDHPDAQRIRADAASWAGDHRSARRIYERLLAQRDDNETRIGYTYTLIASGAIEAARENLRGLSVDPRGRGAAFERLSEALVRETTAHAQASLERYSDSDDNVRRSSGLALRSAARPGRIGIELSETVAEDPNRTVTMRQATLQGRLPINEPDTLEAGVGIATIEHGDADAVATGHLQFDSNSPLAVRLGLRRSLYKDTAQILENTVVANEYFAGVRASLTDAVRLDADYAATSYSDDNHSKDLSLSGRYAVRLQQPRVTLGLRREQVGYDRQSGSGYFDPDRLVSNQALLGVAAPRPWGQMTLEFFTGNQTFERSSQRERNTIAGWYAALRIEAAKQISLEAQWEGGNFALQTTGGYRYQTVGLKLLGRF